MSITVQWVLLMSAKILSEAGRDHLSKLCDHIELSMAAGSCHVCPEIAVISIQILLVKEITLLLRASKMESTLVNCPT